MNFKKKILFAWIDLEHFYKKIFLCKFFTKKFFFANFLQTHGSNWDTFFKKNFPCKYKNYFYEYMDASKKKFLCSYKKIFLTKKKKFSCNYKKKKFPATVRKFLCNNKNFFTIIKKIRKSKLKKEANKLKYKKGFLFVIICNNYFYF